jgi:hypothetical protein
VHLALVVVPDLAPRLQFGCGQVMVDFAKPSYLFEGRQAHLGVWVGSGHHLHRLPPETMLVVPSQSIGIRLLAHI